MNKLISVILSTYNNENTIEDAVDSILLQTYKNVELLVVDDCSTDRTSKILQDRYSNTENIQLFKNPENIGLTKSLNFLIKQSKGDFIARQDADDISLPERLETQINLFKNYDIDFCTSRALKHGTKNKIPGYSYFIPKKISIKFKNPFIHGTLIIKKNVIEEIGNYDEKFYYSQDYKLFLDLIRRQYSYIDIPKPLYILNTKNNISTIYKKQQKYYANCARNRIVPDYDKSQNIH